MKTDVLMRMVCISLIFSFQFSILDSSVHAQQRKRVLFIGNSYTQVNNLPRMVAEVAASMGDTLSYGENTPGGCTFNQHCTNQSMTLIQQGGWDAVVLQEQSQLPSFPQSQVEYECFPYAQRLVDSIYAHGWCTEPMFYMTWGRKNGDQQNAQFFPPLGTYEGMDSLLCLRYMQMASDNDASVCPVGRVWRRLREDHSEIELYQSDGSHPSVEGSYAAACAFYTMLFLRNPEEITYEAGLESDVARTIRSVVRSVVYDTLSQWQRVPPAIQVVEENTQQDMSCSFTLECADCDTLLCNWGDGNTELYPSPATTNVSHTYADTGLYTLSFTALRHCMSTTETRTFHATGEPAVPQGIGDVPQEQITLSPNPAWSTATVYLPAGAIALELCSMDGRVISTYTPQGDSCSLEVGTLPLGTYVLRVQFPYCTVAKKLIIVR